MNEFNNRVEAQRTVLRIVNTRGWNEQLTGLSADAISRWQHQNAVPDNDEVVGVLYQVAEALMCLGVRSQELVTIEYEALSAKVSELTELLRSTLDESATRN